jgi:hypothetical protein
MNKLILDDGKYEIQYSDDMETFKCLRYGEEWRDLTGDMLILALVNKINELNLEADNLDALLSGELP